jgi:flagellar biogenesis protein FliO
MNRFFVLLCLVLSSSFALAEDGILGTKGDASSALQGPASTGGSLLQMIIAVLVVFGLMKFMLPKVMAKFGGKLNPGLGSSIKIEESASFQGGTLYLVSVKDRSLLLGVAGSSITTLADLGNANKPDPGPTFMEILDVADERNAFNAEPIVKAETIEYALVDTEIQPKDANAMEALQRLQKLMR